MSTLSLTKRLQVIAKTNGHCWYCGVELTAGGSDPKRWVTIDHQNGRSNALDNLVPACHSCNASKNQRDLETYRLSLQRKASPYLRAMQALTTAMLAAGVSDEPYLLKTLAWLDGCITPIVFLAERQQPERKAVGS